MPANNSSTQIFFRLALSINNSFDEKYQVKLLAMFFLATQPVSFSIKLINSTSLQEKLNALLLDCILKLPSPKNSPKR